LIERIFFDSLIKEMEEKKDTKIGEALCPCCGCQLWFDLQRGTIVKFKRSVSPKKKGSLDELILKEKKRKEEFERKFELSVELEKKKREEAHLKFKKALQKVKED